MEKLTHLDKELLLRAVAHHMPQDLRGKLMNLLPQSYNRWMGSEIMAVSITPPPHASEG